jgi:hypothetical protein
MARTTEISRGHAIGGGILAGIVGGIVMDVLMAFTASQRGRDIWPVFKGAATPFLHDRAMRPGFDAGAVALGSALHLGIAIVWGLIFALVAYGLPRSATVVAGAMYGVVVWLVMYFIVLPIAGLGAMAHSAPIVGPLVMHVIFGLTVAVAFLPFQRTRRHLTPATGATAY